MKQIDKQKWIDSIRGYIVELKARPHSEELIKIWTNILQEEIKKYVYEENRDH